MKKNKKNKKILITGGGTGGHVMPLKSIVQELKKHHVDLLYVGSGSNIENDFAKSEHIEYKKIFTGKYRRYFDWQNFVDIFKIIIGTIQSFFIILFHNPEIVFSKGGYVGLPVIYAAWVLRKKIYIHETDSVMGLANKLSVSKCKEIFVSYPARYYPLVPASKIVYTGNPIRDEFKRVKKNKIFNNSKKTILVTGGSQGARFLNQTIAKILEELTKKYNVIHVCGENDFDWLNKNRWKNYKLYKFSNDLPKMMYNSDLVISRSGGTIFEIAYCKKAAILIPLPTSANNHQQENAKIFEKENAAVVLSEKKLSSESLLDIINLIMDDKKMKEDLEGKISQFANPDAAKVIVENLLKK